MVAHDRDLGRHCRHARAGLAGVGQVRHRAGRCLGGRGRRAAMEFQLSFSRQGRRARHHEYSPRESGESVRDRPQRPQGSGRCRGVGSGIAFARRQTGEGPGARQGRPAPIRGTGVSGQDGHGARNGDLLLADPHPHGNLRCALRAVMRNGALHHARARDRRRGEGLSSVARQRNRLMRKHAPLPPAMSQRARRPMPCAAPAMARKGKEIRN